VSTNTIAACAAIACSLLAGGCEATFTPVEPVVTVSAGASVAPAVLVPPDIFSSPRVWFDGSWAYLVDGVWYYPTSRGWYVYLREPAPLARERTRITVTPRQPAYGYPPPRTTPPEEFGRERRPLPP